MNKELERILKSGEVKNEQEARTFAESAAFEYAENGWGDFRIETEGGFAEIYGEEVQQGDETIPEPVSENGFQQKIRFYNDFGEISADDFLAGKDLTNLEILMLDGCTKADAERHLANGTTVYEGKDFEEGFDEYMREWHVSDDGELLDEFKRMIDEKKPVRDWGIVEHRGKTWYIEYSL